MSRFLTVAKYLPAVLCGLLVVAWVVSLCNHYQLGFASRWIHGNLFHVSCARGGISLSHTSIPGLGNYYTAKHSIDLEAEGRSRLGTLEIDRAGPSKWITCPISLLLTLSLPLAIGPFIRFRFPLWSYFAFTALVAVELAYYLR